MNSAQQWLDTHPDQSTDYALLVNRLFSGEVVECLISLGAYKGLADADYEPKWYGDLFTLTTKTSDFLPFAGKRDFVEFCAKNKLVFAQKDFLSDTRRLLEIARNAAEFKAVSVPLNTREDVDALLELMDGLNAG